MGQAGLSAGLPFDPSRRDEAYPILVMQFAGPAETSEFAPM